MEDSKNRTFLVNLGRVGVRVRDNSENIRKKEKKEIKISANIFSIAILATMSNST